MFGVRSFKGRARREECRHCAGPAACKPIRHGRCCLLVRELDRYLGIRPVSQLNTRPVVSPVNASQNLVHHSGSGWLARPSPWGTRTSDSLPAFLAHSLVGQSQTDYSLRRWPAVRRSRPMNSAAYADHIHKGKTMRTAILAVIAAICLGLIAGSTVSAAPAYGASIAAAAAGLDLRQDAYVYRPHGRYYGYGGYRGYYGYGGYRRCFQTCPGRSG
jgi:hypothetical protein